MNEKTIKFTSEIFRGIGMIEGVSYGLDEAAAQALIDAVGIIENAVNEMTGMSKPDDATF